jgi:hypothetical protein
MCWDSHREDIRKILQALHEVVGEVEVNFEKRFVVVEHDPKSQDMDGLSILYHFKIIIISLT